MLDGTVHGRRSPARLDQLLQLGHQGLHDQGQDRPAAPGSQARHDRPGRDPGRSQDQRADAFPSWRSCSTMARTTSPRKSTIGSCRPKSSWASPTRSTSRSLKGLNEGDVVAMSPMSLMTDEEKRKAFGSASKGGKKDWGEDGAAEAGTAKGGRGSGRRDRPRRSPVRPGRARQGRRPGQGQGQGRRRNGQGRARRQSSRVLRRNSRASARKSEPQLRSPDLSEEDKKQLYKKAGLTDAEIQQMAEMRKNFGGGGGGGGFGGGGPAAAAVVVVAAADPAARGREDRTSERGPKSRPSQPASRSSGWST